MAREGIMLAYPFDSARFERYPKPVITQPKIEGDRCRAVFDSRGRVTLFSSGAKVRISVPHINKQLEALNLVNIELDGELYIHNVPHEEIRSMVSRTKYLHPEYEKVNYYIFDVINEMIQHARTAWYTNLITRRPLPNLVPVTWKYCRNFNELNEDYNYYLSKGYEGIIIRDAKSFYRRKKSTSLMKLKPRLAGEYKIIGFEEEFTITGQPKGSLGALVLQDEEGKIFNVGTGFTRDQRRKFWATREKLRNRIAKIRYQALTHEAKVPKMASFEEILPS